MFRCASSTSIHDLGGQLVDRVVWLTNPGGTCRHCGPSPSIYSGEAFRDHEAHSQGAVRCSIRFEIRGG